MLDLESVRLFLLAAEFGNLTRAAEAAGTVQPVVSQRLKALEATLGRKLLDRSPRFVRPTADGAAFLIRARRLLASHEEALRFGEEPALRLTIGASDHALGLALEPLLLKLRAVLPERTAIAIRVGRSLDMHAAFDTGRLDAAILRREAGGGEGEVLGTDPLGWRAADGWSVPAGSPLPLAILEAPCGVRASAVRHLDQARLPWREAFVAGSCTALLAGARAGFGVAPMGRIASGNVPDAGPSLGLPPLPPSEIVLLARAGSPAAASAMRVLASAIRAALS